MRAEVYPQSSTSVTRQRRSQQIKGPLASGAWFSNGIKETMFHALSESRIEPQGGKEKKEESLPHYREQPDQTRPFPHLSWTLTPPLRDPQGFRPIPQGREAVRGVTDCANFGDPSGGSHQRCEERWRV